jgi:hypothetical protein
MKPQNPYVRIDLMSAISRWIVFSERAGTRSRKSACNRHAFIDGIADVRADEKAP